MLHFIFSNILTLHPKTYVFLYCLFFLRSVCWSALVKKTNPCFNWVNTDSLCFQENLLTQTIIDKMPSADRQKYYELSKENNNLIKSIQNMQSEIKKCKEMIHVHAEHISKSKVSYCLFLKLIHILTLFSQNKQRKLELMKNIRQLQKQKDELEENLRNTLTPEQQREMLLQQVTCEKYLIYEREVHFNNSRWSKTRRI